MLSKEQKNRDALHDRFWHKSRQEIITPRVIPKEVLQDVARQLGTNSAAHKVLELGNAEQRKGYDVRYSYDPSGPFYRVHRSLTTRMIYAMPLGRAWRLLQHVLVK